MFVFQYAVVQTTRVSVPISSEREVHTTSSLLRKIVALVLIAKTWISRQFICGCENPSFNASAFKLSLKPSGVRIYSRRCFDSIKYTVLTEKRSSSFKGATS